MSFEVFEKLEAKVQQAIDTITLLQMEIEELKEQNNNLKNEMSQASAEKIAPYAEKHDMFYILHNHMQYATEEFMAGPDKVLAVSPKIMLNFDMGHYFALLASTHWTSSRSMVIVS